MTRQWSILYKHMVAMCDRECDILCHSKLDLGVKLPIVGDFACVLAVGDDWHGLC